MPGPCIVVGYDGSDAARVALRHAARRAGADGVVVAVHAFEPPADWRGAPYYQRILDEHRGRGEALLESLPQEEGVHYETELIGEHAADAIVRVAQTHDADEIVVGSHGYGALRGALGSVSHAVIHAADRPVVVIPPGAVERETG